MKKIAGIITIMGLSLVLPLTSAAEAQEGGDTAKDCVTTFTETATTIEASPLNCAVPVQFVVFTALTNNENCIQDVCVRMPQARQTVVTIPAHAQNVSIPKPTCGWYQYDVFGADVTIPRVLNAGWIVSNPYVVYGGGLNPDAPAAGVFLGGGSGDSGPCPRPYRAVPAYAG